MDRSPFFSVCIPNYNYSNYIGLTIESVLAQSFSDFEVIIVDNASTDNSWEVIQNYALRDTRIRCFRNNYNIGFAPNLQRATEKAVGRFVILLSSDDLMSAGALDSYYEVISNLGEPLDNLVLHSAFDQIDSVGGYVRTGFNVQGRFKIEYERRSKHDSSPGYFCQDPIEAVRFAVRTNYGIAAFLTTCYSRKLWERVEGYDPHYLIFPDKAFLFKLLLQEPTYVFVTKSLFGYRVHANNQNAKNAGMTALKHQMDGYVRAISFSDADLTKLGFTRRDIQFYFIRNLCERHALIAIKDNQRLKAFKILSFALGCFPAIAVRNSKLWLLSSLLLLGPFGPPVSRLLFRIYKNSRVEKYVLSE